MEKKYKPIFFPLWMKVIKVIGDSNKPLSIKEISSIIGSIDVLRQILEELEIRGLAIRNKQDKGIITIILTSRGKLIWKSLSDIEITIGIRIEKS